MPNPKLVPGLSLMAIISVDTLAAAADRSVPAALEDAPNAWLSAAGKSEEWKAATARCRELLAKLHLQDARVQKHLPKVKEKVQLLLRTPDFDWRKKTAALYLQNMLEDLQAGREPLLRYAGKGFAYPYWSNTLRRIEATWVHVPPTYDSGKSYQLFIYYKCGGGIHLKDGKAHGIRTSKSNTVQYLQVRISSSSRLSQPLCNRLPLTLPPFPCFLISDKANRRSKAMFSAL